MEEDTPLGRGGGPLGHDSGLRSGRPRPRTLDMHTETLKVDTGFGG
jgi:hypothetical protein